MTAAATTLKNILFGNWGLTGELNKELEGSGSTLMDEVVQFFDRLQVIGNETTKAVIVEKINAEGNEGLIQHPNFNELTDTYEITVRYRVVDVNATNYSDSLDFVEQMAGEVVRILKTEYNPSSTQNVYFQTMNNWLNLDVDKGNQRDLRRQLRFTLTTITSDDPDVYTGFGGVLVFDGPSSSADNDDDLVNYTFAAVKNIDCDEGFSQIPTLTKDTTPGVGVPLLMRGQFSGRFSALMYAEKSNILGSTAEKLKNIYRLQTIKPLIGQNAEIVLLRTNTNTEVLDKVTEIRVTNPGSGYSSAPITFPAVINAIATANVVDKQVVSIDVSSGGNNYTFPPTVTIDAPTGANPIQAIAEAVIGNNQVVAVVITNLGNGYDGTPNVAFSSTGSGASATATIVDEQISSITVVSGGLGFEAPPLVTIGGDGNDAEAIAIIQPTLTRKSFMKINQLRENSPDQDLVSYTIIGTLSRPTIFTENI